MEAKELRIGNCVSIDGQIVQLGEDALEVLFAARNYTDLTPVPLAGEILESIGFQQHGEGEFYYFHPHYSVRDKAIKLYSTSDNCHLEYKVEGIDNWQLIEIKYLHQLQNLYFALTGEELEISL
jgi:hypothetical protein